MRHVVPTALLAASCGPRELVTNNSECTFRSNPVPADWAGPSEAELLAPLDGPIPALVVWDALEQGEVSPVSVVASRAAGPATVRTRHGNEARCEIQPPEIHVPVTFEVDVGDGLASGTLEGTLWAMEGDATVQVSARGPAALSEAWQVLARRALHAGGPVTHELAFSGAWAPGLGLLAVEGSAESAIVPGVVSGSVWSGVWYDASTPLPDGPP